MNTFLTDSKTEVIARTIAARHGGELRRLLVVGCGSGLEAAILAQRLASDVVGIDIVTRFDAGAARHAHLVRCDARSLAFADRSFDFVYSFHALEHIPSPLEALREIRRILRPGGGFFIGTPNRARLIGYLGSKTATLQQKIQWNLGDWRARLAGRFTNELGAHAGFTSNELGSMIRKFFPDTEEETQRYYLELYSGRRRLIQLLIASGIGRWAFPSVYFGGRAAAGDR